MSYISFLISRFLNFLFPPACPICADPIPVHGTFCDACLADFDWIDDPKCVICGYPFPTDLDLGPAPMCPACAAGENKLDRMRAACVYDEFSRNVMLPFKHAAALRFQMAMANHMIFAIRELDTEIDLVIPVPLAYRRLCKRGYNQATLLARPIAKYLGKKMDLDSITREYRPDMGHKNAKQRAENIRGVFTIKNPDAVRGKTVLLVDDVMTTGATFAELHRVLKRAGAAKVLGVTFCRTVRTV